MATEIEKGAEDDVLVEEDLTALDDSTDWKAKAEELEQKRREDGIKQRERTKALKKELEEAKKAKESKDKPQEKESAELDWGQKAFLKASGLTTAEEMKLAHTFGKRNELDLDAVLEDDDFKAKLERHRTTKANELAAEGKSGRGGAGAGGQRSVEYWLAKGEHPPKELGKELAEKYVEARRSKGKSTAMFYND